MSLVEVFYFFRGVDKFHVVTEHFPENTKERIPVNDLLRLGILPLGIKHRTKWFRSREYLNIGVLDPKLPGLHREVKSLSLKAVGANYGGYRLYRIALPEYLEVMQRVYHLSEEQVRNGLKLNHHS